MSHVNVELFESSMQLCISHAIHAETSKHGAESSRKGAVSVANVVRKDHSGSGANFELAPPCRLQLSGWMSVLS